MTTEDNKKFVTEMDLVQALQGLRDEITVLPRFAYHQPLDYAVTTLPPAFDAPVHVPGEELPLPPPLERMGYSTNDAEYLNWGKFDHDLICERIKVVTGEFKTNSRILDFGCSSGRVLRHFQTEHKEFGWSPIGVDVQARPIEWMRQNFPPHFCIYVGSIMPKLPFEDNSIDFIYGFSIFTHVKFLWDFWILELRRVLKPGGLLLQTFHAESAWKFYHDHSNEEYVRVGLPERVWGTSEMDVPFLYHGDVGVSQVFWKADVAKTYFGRYMEVLEVYPPAKLNSFQDMIVCRK